METERDGELMGYVVYCITRTEVYIDVPANASYDNLDNSHKIALIPVWESIDQGV